MQYLNESSIKSLAWRLFSEAEKVCLRLTVPGKVRFLFQCLVAAISISICDHKYFIRVLFFMVHFTLLEKKLGFVLFGGSFFLQRVIRTSKYFRSGNFQNVWFQPKSQEASVYIYLRLTRLQNSLSTYVYFLAS